MHETDLSYSRFFSSYLKILKHKITEVPEVHMQGMRIVSANASVVMLNKFWFHQNLIKLQHRRKQIIV